MLRRPERAPRGGAAAFDATHDARGALHMGDVERVQLAVGGARQLQPGRHEDHPRRLPRGLLLALAEHAPRRTRHELVRSFSKSFHVYHWFITIIFVHEGVKVLVVTNTHITYLILQSLWMWLDLLGGIMAIRLLEWAIEPLSSTTIHGTTRT